MSNVSGFWKTSASRFPDCVAAIIPSPALIVCGVHESVIDAKLWKMSHTLPPRVMSTLATRRVARAEAVWKRHSSSTKIGARDGDFFRSASWAGFSNKVTIPYETENRACQLIL
jgi:hypothetical protein